MVVWVSHNDVKPMFCEHMFQAEKADIVELANLACSLQFGNDGRLHVKVLHQRNAGSCDGVTNIQCDLSIYICFDVA